MMQCVKHDLKFLRLKTVSQCYRWEQTSPVWTHLRLPSNVLLPPFLREATLGDFTLLVLGAADERPSPHSFTSGQASWLCTHLSLVTMLVLLKSSETPQPVFRELQLAFCVHSHQDESIVKILDCLQKSLENFLNDLWLVFSAHFFLLF